MKGRIKVSIGMAIFIAMYLSFGYMAHKEPRGIQPGSNAYRLMVKYGRQIPTAPINSTIAWHVERGD